MLSANFDVIRGFSRVLTLLEFIPSSDRSSLSSGPDNYEIAKISERNCSEISLYFGGINFDSGICGIELSGIETNSIERMLRVCDDQKAGLFAAELFFTFQTQYHDGFTFR